MAKAKKEIARKKPAAKKPVIKSSGAKINKTLIAAKNKVVTAKSEYGKLLTKSLVDVQKSDTQANSKKRAVEAQKNKFKKLRVTLAAKAKKSASKTTLSQLKKAKASYDSAAKDATKLQAEAVTIKASVAHLKLLQNKYATLCKLIAKFEKDWAKKLASSKTKKPRKKKRKQTVKKDA